MAQTTINERLKILIEALGLSARAFSSEIGSGDTNTRNYLDRGSKPGADYLEKVVRRFETVNSVWLLTGEGEAFTTNQTDSSGTQVGNFNQTGTGNIQKVKGNKNNVQTNNGDHATITNNVKLDDCHRDLRAAQKEIALLTSQLADKERIIQLLEKSK